VSLDLGSFAIVGSKGYTHNSMIYYVHDKVELLDLLMTQSPRVLEENQRVFAYGSSQRQLKQRELDICS
jgi:hypothetical protein